MLLCNRDLALVFECVHYKDDFKREWIRGVGCCYVALSSGNKLYLKGTERRWCVIDDKPKNLWIDPELIRYGSVEELTEKGPVKSKMLGTSDDFGVVGVSSAP